MKADRHDFRRVRAFSMKPTEGIDHIRCKIAGARRTGWCGRIACRLYRTRKVAPSAACRLLVEEGAFIYDSDAYRDDLQYRVEGRRVVIGRSPTATAAEE